MMELETIVEELSASSQRVGTRGIDALISAIEGHSRIFVYGTGRSGLMLKALAMRLMQLGYEAYVVGETTTPSVTKGDLLVIASASGQTGSVVLTAESALRQGVDLFAVSSTATSELGRLHAIDVIIESGTKLSSSQVTVQPLGSLFEQMLLLLFDGAILKIFESRDTVGDDMAKRHASLE